jgi:hypothetical protein
MILAALLIVVFRMTSSRISDASFRPAPYSSHEEKQAPSRKPRQHNRNECQLSPTSPVGDGKSLTEVLIAVLHASFRCPSLFDAALVLVTSYTLIVVFPI